MKIAIVGSREFKDKELIRSVIENFGMIWSLVSGGARGVDSIAENIVDELNYINPFTIEHFMEMKL